MLLGSLNNEDDYDSIENIVYTTTWEISAIWLA